MTTYDYRSAAAGDIDAMMAYNLQLAKLLQKLKKDAGAQSVAANYKGTGSQRHKRQLWVNFKNGKAIDLFLEDDFIQFGGVLPTFAGLPKRLPYKGRTPEEVYAEVRDLLKKALQAPAHDSEPPAAKPPSVRPAPEPERDDPLSPENLKAGLTKRLEQEMNKIVRGAGKVTYVQTEGPGSGWQVVFDTEYAALKVYYQYRHSRGVNFGKASAGVGGGWYVSVL